MVKKAGQNAQGNGLFSRPVVLRLKQFDPAAFGPACGTVRLTVYSENEPDKGDARVVDQKVLEQITQDFAPL